VRHVLRAPGTRALDLCCGTGDLLLALEAARGGAVWGSDFCHPMLTSAARKVSRRGFRSCVFEADALEIPVRDAVFDLVTVAFGFRNLANYRKGLEEMRRVLRPGGMAAILEFSQPPSPLFAGLYNFYSRNVLPVLGGALSGSKDAYAYLPESVRKFPSAEELAGQMREAGFRSVTFERITGGIVCLHLGEY
jgi:demethylmenaquinone methyltransferase/2-methoxy-6-polyprenyl-1,4-benzoquinol methylase